MMSLWLAVLVCSRSLHVEIVDDDETFFESSQEEKEVRKSSAFGEISHFRFNQFRIEEFLQRARALKNEEPV